MVAKISTGKSIRGILHYNENKVSAGEARLILSSGFAGDIEKMDFPQKLQRFQHLTELKPNVKTNAMWIKHSKVPPLRHMKMTPLCQSKVIPLRRAKLTP